MVRVDEGHDLVRVGVNWEGGGRGGGRGWGGGRLNWGGGRVMSSCGFGK